MKSLYAVHPIDFAAYSTKQIRDQFLIENLVQQDKIELAYTHYDRMLVGAACPVSNILTLGTYDELKAPFFLSRREMGVVCIAGAGTITVDGEKFSLQKLDCLYIGMGSKEVKFSSDKKSTATKFIFFSCPAHQTYPTKLMTAAEAMPAELGSLENNNHRTINKYIHNDGLQSCQLVMGVTNFKQGSIWNTMPPHTHDRRMEIYFYFDLAEDQRIIHFMGQPQETRHLFLNNEEAVVSPPWSIHCGVATSNYSFIWAMAGENKEFTDMDGVNIKELQ